MLPFVSFWEKPLEISRERFYLLSSAVQKSPQTTKLIGCTSLPYVVRQEPRCSIQP